MFGGEEGEEGEGPQVCSVESLGPGLSLPVQRDPALRLVSSCTRCVQWYANKSAAPHSPDLDEASSRDEGRRGGIYILTYLNNRWLRSQGQKERREEDKYQSIHYSTTVKWDRYLP